MWVIGPRVRFGWVGHEKHFRIGGRLLVLLAELDQRLVNTELVHPRFTRHGMLNRVEH